MNEHARSKVECSVCAVQEKQEYVKRMKLEEGQSIHVSLYNWPFDTTQVVDLSRLQMERERTQFDEDNEIKVRYRC